MRIIFFGLSNDGGAMLDRNILKGESIRLTAVEKDDLATIGRWYEDAGFARLFDALPAAPKNTAQLSEWLDAVQKDKQGYLFAIRPIDEETLLGFAELDGIMWANRNAWLALGFGKRENWGKGYGKQAMQLLLGFAFDELNLHRVQLTVFDYNVRAITLYERLGFAREGTYREHLQRDGQYHDMHLYGLLRREWRASVDGRPTPSRNDA